MKINTVEQKFIKPKSVSGIRHKALTGTAALLSLIVSSTFAQSPLKALQKDTVQINKELVEKKTPKLFEAFKKDPEKAKIKQLVKGFKANYPTEYKYIKENRAKPMLAGDSFLIFPPVKSKFTQGDVTLNDTSYTVFSNWKNVSIVGTLEKDKVIIEDSQKIKYLPLSGDDSTFVKNSSNVSIIDKQGANFVSLDKTNSGMRVSNYSTGSVIVNESNGAQVRISNTTLVNDAEGVTMTLGAENTVINGKKDYDAIGALPNNKKKIGSTSPSYININGKNNVIYNYSRGTSINGRNPSTKVMADRSQR